MVGNVYPRIDDLQVVPARRAIQQVFEEHITDAPGMERIRELVDGSILPTPGAVMDAAEVLYADLGDLLVVDVGGATTDVHLVTTGSPEMARLALSPEPLAKRTVEGDLGVYMNAKRAAELWRLADLAREVGLGQQRVAEMSQEPKAVPKAPEDERLAALLARAAAREAVLRHAGRLRYLHGPGGASTIVEGRDLTQVRWLIGTGGALTRLPGGRAALAALRGDTARGSLLPGAGAEVRLDTQYVMAACGVMAREHPSAARSLIKRSLGL